MARIGYIERLLFYRLIAGGVSAAAAVLGWKVYVFYKFCNLVRQ